MSRKIIVTAEEIEESLLNPISDYINPYFVAILGSDTTSSLRDMFLVGSGTLIRFEDLYCVLTADHVVQILDGKEYHNHLGYDRIGFVAPRIKGHDPNVTPVTVYREE